MNLWLWLVLAVALIGLYVWYAVIVTRRNRVSEALAGIDVQLNQRHDLIPNLLAIARRFMEHEKGLLEEITELRARAAGPVRPGDPQIAEKFSAEAALGARMDALFAVAENYPELQSHAPMIEAQRGYQEVETNIAAARRFYNAAVADLRNAIQIFPGQLLAGLAGVGPPPPFFEVEAKVRAPVNAADHL